MSGGADIPVCRKNGRHIWQTGMSAPPCREMQRGAAAVLPRHKRRDPTLDNGGLRNFSCRADRKTGTKVKEKVVPASIILRGVITSPVQARLTDVGNGHRILGSRAGTLSFRQDNEPAQRTLFAENRSYRQGAVAKWLRQRIANPPSWVRLPPAPLLFFLPILAKCRH